MTSRVMRNELLPKTKTDRRLWQNLNNNESFRECGGIDMG